MLIAVAAGKWMETSGGLAQQLGAAIGGTGVHGGFVACGFLIALEGRPGWHLPAMRVAATLGVAFALGRLAPWGSAVYIIPPALLVWEARRQPILSRIGAPGPARLTDLLLGIAAGGFLGVHLLISASLTLGYAVRVASVSGYLSGVAYDVGANALSAEWLFRGALFSHWWRHWGFWAAAVTSTAMGVVRYLLDPGLPRTPEVGAGAIFYLALLGLAASALRASSGSLVPGYLAAVAFFTAYRALSVW